MHFEHLCLGEAGDGRETEANSLSPAPGQSAKGVQCAQSHMGLSWGRVETGVEACYPWVKKSLASRLQGRQPSSPSFSLQKASLPKKQLGVLG